MQYNYKFYTMPNTSLRVTDFGFQVLNAKPSYAIIPK